MNSTTNRSSWYVPPTPTAQKIGETLAYCLIFVVSLVGNPIIAFIVYKTKSMRKPINYFIVSMAMSDLQLTILVIPWNLAYLYSDRFWLMAGPLGQALCKLVLFLTAVSSCVSIVSLIVIALDRFGAVVYPFRPLLISSKRCPYIIVSTWIVAMAIFSPILFGAYLRGDAACLDGFIDTRYHFVAAVCFYFPLLVLVILYTIIIVKLKSQRIPGEQSGNAEELRVRRNSQVLKMAIAIVLGFALCWLPYSIFGQLANFGLVIDDVYTVSFLMALSNCAINPCICFIFSENYRQGLKRIFKCFGIAWG